MKTTVKDYICRIFGKEPQSVKEERARQIQEALNKDKQLQYIRSMVSTPEQLAQFAEEASEATQAALKYRRTLIGDNPTPVSKETAYEAFMEELGDIIGCLEVLDIALTDPIIHTYKDSKRERWVKRLHEKENEQKESAGNENQSTIAD